MRRSQGENRIQRFPPQLNLSIAGGDDARRAQRMDNRVPRERKPYARHMDFAWALIINPTILLFPLTWGALNDPSVILEYWDLFLPFFGIPYAAALVIWLYVRQMRRAARLK